MCERVHHFNSSEQCAFVRGCEQCQEDEQFIPYMTFVYCAFGSGNTPPALVCLVIALLTMFVGLGITADDFLAPALIVISDTLRLSQNIAGITFLAFGNGAPDIISSLAGIQQARPDLVIGELFGAGIYVVCVVAGSICLTQDFKIMERPFLRDIIFYIGATYWAFYIFYTQKMTLYHSIGFIILYIMFIAFVVTSRVVYQHMKEKELAKAEEAKLSKCSQHISTIHQQMNGDQTGNYLAPPPVPLTFSKAAHEEPEPEPEDMGIMLRRFSFRESISHRTRRPTVTGVHLHNHRRNSIFMITASEQERMAQIRSRASSKASSRRDSVSNQNGMPAVMLSPQAASSLSALVSIAASVEDLEAPQLSPLRELGLHLLPIDLNEWPEKKWYGKLYEVCKAPIYFILTLTTPVVDYENDKNNWCRLLNSLHCVISPMFILLVTQVVNITVAGFPIAVIVFLVAACLALVVFFTSKYDEPPKYHWIFAYLGFFVAVFWIYGLANEVVSLLKTVGIVIGLSDAFLGMTVLAWGNSIGDFISNLAVARQGYPRMAISACYGGPLLNLLLGFGIPYTLKLVQTGGVLRLRWSNMIAVLYGTICQTLVSTLVVMTILRFTVRRAFGAYLLVVYATYLTVAILIEAKVL
ncbi:mitochondrial sodium/calcium exchanger protein-like isoform X2 [Ornithodoros turicata]|uniref:mitochondrial sodium/calcium exchanger protein-like isoform X2 n=1 Tax=Ornithodoros turicata TaxID=34597 RepID=UPI00313A44C9